MKTKLALICLIGILSTVFVSCSKKNATEPTKVTAVKVDLAKIDRELKQLNSHYAYHGVMRTTATTRNGWVVAGADLLGAATVGKTVCPGLASFGFLGIGAGLLLTAAGGAYASYAVYGITVVKDHNGLAPVQKMQIVNNVGTYSVPNPYNNPCENAGIQHNNFVKILCQKSVDVPANPATLIYDKTDLTNDELAMIADDQNQYTYKTGLFASDPNNMLDANGNLTLTPFINYSFSSDPTLQTIFTDLINGMNQTTDVETCVALINSYENYFLSNPDYLDQWQQYSILTGCSVGKYSLTMWTDAYSAH